MRQTVSPLIQFAIAQTLITKYQRNRIRRALDLSLKQTMNGLIERILGIGRVEAAQHLFTLSLGQYRQAAQRRLRRQLQRFDQLLQRRLHIAADTPGIDTLLCQRSQQQVISQIVDVQGQRIVGALLTRQTLDALPGLAGLWRDLPGSAMPIVEQRAEQWHGYGRAAAALGQCQRSMFMAQQFGQPPMSSPDSGTDPLLCDGKTQRQGIDEQTNGTVRAFAALHAAHQYSTEHHVLLARNGTQHHPPCQVNQAGKAHTQMPCLIAQALIQTGDQQLGRILDTLTVALHILQAERQRGLFYIAQHAAKE
ncbi:hypothetical protein PSCICJ_04300 [Pseudomonas cichorii]|nr:hypothetical protein PSCICJ_04300 [Pseudomonas cichorii]